MPSRSIRSPAIVLMIDDSEVNGGGTAAGTAGAPGAGGGGGGGGGGGVVGSPSSLSTRVLAAAQSEQEPTNPTDHHRRSPAPHSASAPLAPASANPQPDRFRQTPHAAASLSNARVELEGREEWISHHQGGEVAHHHARCDGPERTQSSHRLRQRLTELEEWMSSSGQ